MSLSGLSSYSSRWQSGSEDAAAMGEAAMTAVTGTAEAARTAGTAATTAAVAAAAAAAEVAVVVGVAAAAVETDPTDRFIEIRFLARTTRTSPAKLGFRRPVR
jgi:hypothetical protein